jgi:FlaA1/EpsC-like NDP-sugar epimerase
MTRYFMTIKEAVLLVIEAMVLGEAGATYILEMGEPVPILELAQNLLALSGYDPENGDTGPGIEIVGLRPGERLHEALVEPDELVEPSPNPLIRTARPRQVRPFDPAAVVAALGAPAAAGDRQAVRAALARILPGFGSQEPRERGDA